MRLERASMASISASATWTPNHSANPLTMAPRMPNMSAHSVSQESR